MADPLIVRELVDGEWVTTVGSSGGGGSQTLAQVLQTGSDGAATGMSDTGPIDTGGGQIGTFGGPITTAGDTVGEGGDLTLDGGDIDTGGGAIDTGGGLIDVGSAYIKNVLDPFNDQDAATKKYVDDNIGGGGVANPLAADLLTGGNKVRGAADSGADGGFVLAEDAGAVGGKSTLSGGDAPADIAGGDAWLVGGNGNGGNTAGAYVYARGGNDVAANGRLTLGTDFNNGAVGQAIVSDGADGTLWGGVISAAGVPTDPPVGFLPFAYDTTAVSGGFYFWNGAAWVKVATIL